MDLNFIDQLPKMATGNRANRMRAEVLRELIDALAEQPNTWAVYPWQKVRPDLADLGLKSSKVQSHINQLRTIIKDQEPPFNGVQVELVVRQSVPFIRLVVPQHRLRDL